MLQSKKERLQGFFVVALLGVVRVRAIDPVFILKPKTSLTELKVQHVTVFDIEMVVGTSPASSTVISMNGPFTDGHAGMTGVSMRTVTQGTNVDAGDFSTAPTQTSSTAKDGLDDVIFKKFTTVSRTNTSREVVLDNTLKLQASMRTVDKPGASSSDTLWVRCSGEVGDEYVWVSEEATTIARSEGDRPKLSYSIEYSFNLIAYFGFYSEIKIQVSHTIESRINAYNAKVRLYLPPYAGYVSSKRNGAAEIGRNVFVSEQSNNELIITFTTIGITFKPKINLLVKFNGWLLRLREWKEYMTTIPTLFSYCANSTCSPNGAIDMMAVGLNKAFQMPESRGKFLIKHIPSGRCISFIPDRDRPHLNGSCNDAFEYNEHGGWQNVASAQCLGIKSYKWLGRSDMCAEHGMFEVSRTGWLVRRTWSEMCVIPTATGTEGEPLIRVSDCSSSRFRLVDVVSMASRIPMGQKVILAIGDSELFFCNRNKNPSKPSCFYTNGTYHSSIRALPLDMVYVKAWDAAKSHLYGIHQSGKSYAKIDLGQEPHVVYQLEDSLWSAIAAQPGIKLSTDIAQASLKDYPERQETSSFAVSLKGIYQQGPSSTWKLLSRW